MYKYLVLTIYSTSLIYLFILFEFIYILIAYIYIYKTNFDVLPDLKESVRDDRY